MLPAFALVVLAAAPEPAWELESKLRLGLVIGEPLALTVATDLAEGLALHADLGLSHSGDFSAVLTIDVVYRAEHVFGPLSPNLWAMPWVGLGARAAIGEGRADRFGFRVPVGISVLDRREPVELFLQAAVGLSAFPEQRGTIDVGLGVRVGF